MELRPKGVIGAPLTFNMVIRYNHREVLLRGYRFETRYRRSAYNFVKHGALRRANPFGPL